MKTATLAGVLALTHYGYPLFAEGTDDPQAWASWWFYVFRGIEGVVLFYLLSGFVERNRLALTVCWLGMYEEGQTAICGLVAMPDTYVPVWSGLCINQFGQWPYVIIGAAALAYISVGVDREQT